MLRERLLYLMERYFQGNCTDAEKKELALWISTEQDDQVLQEVLDSTWERYQPDVIMPAKMSERIQAALFKNEEPVVRRLAIWRRMAAAAVVLVLMAAGGYLLLNNKTRTTVNVPIVKRMQHEIAPGGNRAVLTLGDGTEIPLDSAGNGLLASQGNVKVVKQANGQLAYELNGQSRGEVLYNTMRTPRGGEFKLTLPDGTRVWLNAASSINFPTIFTGGERNVSVTGEAYFEVAHIDDMPFRVKTGGITVEVLGTHFNINAYPGEQAIRTTLLEGAVKVKTTATETLLIPGQQAGYRLNGDIQVKSNVDMEEVIAWKNGLFKFNDADMPTVMRQLENWYDIKVTYEGDIPKRSFGGGIQRSLPLSRVLQILEENNVKFRVEGKNIIVMK